METLEGGGWGGQHPQCFCLLQASLLIKGISVGKLATGNVLCRCEDLLQGHPASGWFVCEWGSQMGFSQLPVVGLNARTATGTNVLVYKGTSLETLKNSPNTLFILHTTLSVMLF